MPLRPWPARAKDLSRVPLVLAPSGRLRGRLALGAALLAALLAGAGASHAYWRTQVAQWQLDAVPITDFRQAEQALAQTRLQLQMSTAHGRELEHQIVDLNQRLRTSLEELAFFRKGQESRR
ncbi:MAG: hypothetical protein Q8K45_14415 [Rubrivivax sp.]|nr:hypothetical protein [Rubrivivax sp.]